MRREESISVSDQSFIITVVKKETCALQILEVNLVPKEVMVPHTRTMEEGIVISNAEEIPLPTKGKGEAGVAAEASREIV